MRYASSPKMNYPSGSLKARGSATTVALRVLMDQAQKLEIGQRIRALREDSAETNRSIADYCGVSVEAVRNWIAGKGIAYDNGEKVAKLFEVEFNWLWRGQGEPRARPATPDVLGTLTRSDSELLRDVASQVGQLASQVASTEAEVRELLRRIPKPSEGSGES